MNAWIIAALSREAYKQVALTPTTKHGGTDYAIKRAQQLYALRRIIGHDGSYRYSVHLTTEKK